MAWRSLEEAVTRGRGRERAFRCHAHPDTTASASVNVAKGVWYCLDASTRVLTTDLRWVPIGEVSVGDDLIGFDEHADGQRRAWRRSQVQATGVVRRQSYRVELGDGTEVVASGDHQWLAYLPGRSDPVWRRTDQLQTRRGNYVSLCRLTDTWEASSAREAGYVAAGYDGEGSYMCRKVYDDHRRNRQARLIFYQTSDGPMLAEMRRCLDALGLPYATYAHFQRISDRRAHHKAMSQLSTQGKANVMKVLGVTRPARLLTKFDPDDLGVIKPIDKPRVVRVVSLGERDVVAVQTSTGTFVAEGLASHNCYSCGARGTLADVVEADDYTFARGLLEELDMPTQSSYPESWLDLVHTPGRHHPYWLSRFTPAAIDHFRLGYDALRGHPAPCYPMRDATGAVLGLVYRQLDRMPKYLYPARVTKSELLFGYTAERRESVWLVEGALDAVAVWEVGHTAWALYGSLISTEQIRLLHRAGVSRVGLALDNDAAGRTAIRGWTTADGREVPGIAERLSAAGFAVGVLDWCGLAAKDVAELDRDTRQSLLDSLAL